MIFNDVEARAEYMAGGLAPDLYRLIAWTENLFWRLAKRPPCVTNVRKDLGTTKTHSEGRAVDLKTTGPGAFVPESEFAYPCGAAYLTMQQAEMLTRAINDAWDLRAWIDMDHAMLPAVAHVGTAHHIHLQVARNGLLMLREPRL